MLMFNQYCFPKIGFNLQSIYLLDLLALKSHHLPSDLPISRRLRESFYRTHVVFLLANDLRKSLQKATSSFHYRLLCFLLHFLHS